MGGHQAGSHKKQKPFQNSPAVSTSSTNPPRDHPPPLVTPDSPPRHNDNGNLLFSQTSLNSLPLPEPSSVTTASVASHAAANLASLAAA
jgi:hypothetical protein